MKLLITGANGLLGQKLVQLLCEEKVEFLATSNGPSRIQAPDVNYRSMNVSNRDQVFDLVKEYSPTVIIHTAAMTQVDQCETDREKCWELNVVAVGHLIEASYAVNSHLIHLSTDFIFDGLEGPYDEKATAHPVNFYGESKEAAEKLLLKSKIKWSIVRTILVYGATPGTSRSNIMLWVKNNLESGNSIQVVNDQLRTPTLVEDLAKGCYLIASQSAYGIYNIAGADLLTPYEIAIITAGYFSLDKTLITETNSENFKQPAKRPLRTGLIIEKARRDLQYLPHSFEEGLALTASYWD